MAIITDPPANRVEHLEDNLLMVEPHMERDEVLAEPPDEDDTVTVLIEACVPELRSKLEIPQKDVPHKEVRDDIAASTERRRDTLANGPASMDFGNQEAE